MGHHSDDDDLPSWTDLGGDDDDEPQPFTGAETTHDPLCPAGSTSVRDAASSSDTSAAATDLTDVQHNPFVAAMLDESRGAKAWRYIGVAAAAIVAVAVVVGSIIWAVSGSSGSSSRTEPAAATGLSSPSGIGSASVAARSSSCPADDQGGVTTGNGAGGTTGGPAVIEAFDYAYYVMRSGEAARAVAAPDAHVGTAAEIQGGIDKLAPGTSHCLRITDRQNGLWGVELTEIPPNGAAPVMIRQQIQTVVVDGRAWISSIVPDA